MIQLYKSEKIKRRDRLEIIKDILNASIEGGCKTHLVYSTNMNFNFISKYLGDLIEKKLIKKVDKKYYITDTGRRLLEIIKEAYEIID